MIGIVNHLFYHYVILQSPKIIYYWVGIESQLKWSCGIFPQDIYFTKKRLKVECLLKRYFFKWIEFKIKYDPETGIVYFAKNQTVSFIQLDIEKISETTKQECLTTVFLFCH
jgi:hypothetical protein